MRAWRFTISSPLDFEGRDWFIWTAPRELRCGDLILLYEVGTRGGGRGAFVAFGRALTDAVKAYDGDGATWAWVELKTTRSSVPLIDARAVASLSVQGSHGGLDAKVFDRIVRKMIGKDARASRLLGSWREGKGLPRTDQVPISDLITSRLQDDHEQGLHGPIAEALTRQGWRDRPTEVVEAVRRLRGRLAFDPDGPDRALQPDLMMVRPKQRRLLVVEIKRHAAPTQGYRKPVDQVLDYAQASARALRSAKLDSWTVEPLLVAETFSGRVLEHARASKRRPGVEALAVRSWDGVKLRSLV